MQRRNSGPGSGSGSRGGRGQPTGLGTPQARKPDPWASPRLCWLQCGPWCALSVSRNRSCRRLPCGLCAVLCVTRLICAQHEDRTGRLFCFYCSSNGCRKSLKELGFFSRNIPSLQEPGPACRLEPTERVGGRTAAQRPPRPTEPREQAQAGVRPAALPTGPHTLPGNHWLPAQGCACSWEHRPGQNSSRGSWGPASSGPELSPLPACVRTLGVVWLCLRLEEMGPREVRAGAGGQGGDKAALAWGSLEAQPPAWPAAPAGGAAHPLPRAFCS